MSESTSPHRLTRGIKRKLLVTPEQARQITEWLAATRSIYNFCINASMASLEAKKGWLSSYGNREKGIHGLMPDVLAKLRSDKDGDQLEPLYLEGQEQYIDKARCSVRLLPAQVGNSVANDVERAYKKWEGFGTGREFCFYSNAAKKGYEKDSEPVWKTRTCIVGRDGKDVSRGRPNRRSIRNPDRDSIPLPNQIYQLQIDQTLISGGDIARKSERQLKKLEVTDPRTRDLGTPGEGVFVTISAARASKSPRLRIRVRDNDFLLRGKIDDNLKLGQATITYKCGAFYISLSYSYDAPLARLKKGKAPVSIDINDCVGADWGTAGYSLALSDGTAYPPIPTALRRSQTDVVIGDMEFSTITEMTRGIQNIRHQAKKHGVDLLEPGNLWPGKILPSSEVVEKGRGMDTYGCERLDRHHAYFRGEHINKAITRLRRVKKAIPEAIQTGITSHRAGARACRNSLNEAQEYLQESQLSVSQPDRAEWLSIQLDKCRADVALSEKHEREQGRRAWDLANKKRAMRLHIAKDIASRHKYIFVEDCDFKKMRKTKKGTTDGPIEKESGGYKDQGVQRKSSLNRDMANSAPSELIKMIEDKAEQFGGMVIKVPPAYTSKMCSKCGHYKKGQRVTRDKFECKSCGHAEHADINASKNIRRLGLEKMGWIEGKKWTKIQTKLSKHLNLEGATECSETPVLPTD